MHLKEYLGEDVTPSVGYHKLAALTKAGYFDLVLTFNFDRLLEKSLNGAQFTDFKSVIRGETKEDQMQTLVDSRTPLCKIVKLHGSLEATDVFLFDSNEMHQYPDAIQSLVKRVTARNIIVCGYAFNDLCVQRAFAEHGDSIYCVNPSGVPAGLSMFVQRRLSQDNEIRMDFDEFFTALHRELLEPRRRESQELRSNPFKFLESYDEHDSAIFRRREGEIGDFFTFLKRTPAPQVMIVTGPSKAGKTSLVRAGLLAQLDPEKQEGLYLRCRADLEKHAPKCLAGLGLISDGLDLPGALRALSGAFPNRHVVLFLDQFDKTTDPFDPQTKQGKQRLSEFLRTRLFAGIEDRLTVVLVVTDAEVGALLAQECNRNEMRSGTVVCPAFERQDVVEIVQSLAASAEIDLAEKIVEDMADRFEKSKTAVVAKRFTLAHIHAICHMLARKRVTYDDYKRAFDENLDALHQAINVVEFMSFAEDNDFPISAWLRNMVKVPLRESKNRIAEFIKEHYQELLPRDRRAKDRGPVVGNGVGT
jgi:hypothetical protein